MQGVDPVVMKYAGLNREAVNIAVANYGDNPTKVLLSYPPSILILANSYNHKNCSHLKEFLIACFYAFQVQEFANGFTAIREMGFPTNAVAEALFMFENDTDKALSHLLHGSS